MSRHRFVIALFVAAAVVSTRPVTAQDDGSIVTDRPDFTESSLTMQPGSLQFEGGLTIDRFSGRTTGIGPEALLRYGAARRVEVRLVVPNLLLKEGSSDWGSAGVGTKIGLIDGDGMAAAVMATWAIPTDDSGFDALPTTGIIGTRAVDDRHTISGQLFLVPDDGSGEAGWLGSVVVSRAVSARSASFVEVARFPVAGAGAIVLHHGYAFAIAPRTQLDVHGGLGLSGRYSDAFLGAGFARRF